jgi:CheY-like chemotaxis protein
MSGESAAGIQRSAPSGRNPHPTIIAHRPDTSSAVGNGRVAAREEDRLATRVMIVDDAGDFRMLVRAHLRDEPRLAVVAEAASGAEALEALKAVDPDAIVLDYGMPEMSGLETAKEMLRRRPGQIIVMVVGEVGDEDTRRMVDDAGVSACLSKFELRDLRGLILALVSS